MLLLAVAGCSAPPIASTPTVGTKISITPAPPTLAPTNTPPATTPTATNTPQPSPTPTPRPTNTPTPTASPTPQAEPQLSQARQSWRNGDYDTAIAAYKDFLATHPHHPLTFQARFELAQALIAAGDVGQAIPILEELAADEETVSTSPEVLWWLGRAYSSIDAHKSAEAYLQFADLSTELKLEATLAAADALLAAGDAAAAQDAYARALAIAPNRRWAVRAREGIAEAALMSAQENIALDQYQAILAEAQNPNYRAKIFYLLGQVQSQMGQNEAAWKSYRQAIAEAPTNLYAYRALVELVNANQPVDERLRAEIDVNAGAYRPAIGILVKLLAQAPDDAGQLYSLLAKSYEGLKDYSAAAGAWRQALLHLTADEERTEAWMGLGRSLWRQGLRAEARDIYLQAATEISDPDAAATALWWAAVLAGQDEEKWLQAATDFARLAREFPASKYADQAGFRAGLIHYRLADYAAARQLWTKQAAAGDSLWCAAAHFWLGKLLREEGKEQEALAHWQETARRWDEDEFYGVRARQELQKAGTPPTPTPVPPTAENLAEAKAWVAELAGREVTAFDHVPSEFKRITALHRVGEDNQAHRELESLRQKWQDKPVELMQIALFAQELRYYDTSIRAARQLVSLSKRPLLEAPHYVQKLIYPTPYEDLILTAAQKFQIDPALFYALTWQESLFWAPAASHAGAMGLTQIMPGTGQSAARQLAMTDFQTNDLLRPTISIYMGAYILSQELQNTEGDVFRALAAYNAGPGNSSFWWELAEGDSDLFVELITFRETQHYVRTITVQSNHYRRLYPELQKAHKYATITP